MVLEQLLVVIGLLFSLYSEVTGDKQHTLVAYWGQNAAVALGNDKWEKPLVHFCKESSYDVILLAYMHKLFDIRQHDVPAVNFAHHCNTPVNQHFPYLLRCPEIERGIDECHRNGKKVLISIGGPFHVDIIPSAKKAKELAVTVWNLFLGGDQFIEMDIRPFGGAVLDGVNLDIQGGRGDYYVDFLKEIKRLLKDEIKKFIITASPSCNFPDHYLGPAKNKVFGDAVDLFDEIYVKFFNGTCYIGNAEQFPTNMNQWLSFSKEKSGPKIFIGMPSSREASTMSKYYITSNQVAALYEKFKDNKSFGGFALWDASCDQNNLINDKPYSDVIAPFLKR